MTEFEGAANNERDTGSFVIRASDILSSFVIPHSRFVISPHAIVASCSRVTA